MRKSLKWLLGALALGFCLLLLLAATLILLINVRYPSKARPTSMPPLNVATARVTFEVQLTRVAKTPIFSPTPAYTNTPFPTFTPTQIQTTASTPTPTAGTVPTVTKTPLPTSEKPISIAVVDDDSGSPYGQSFRRLAQEALKEVFPNAKIDGYSFCDPRVVAKSYDVIVMDYAMQNSPDGDTCTKSILKVHALTLIVGWADPVWKDSLLRAGAAGFVEKATQNPNTGKLVEEVIKLLNP